MKSRVISLRYILALAAVLLMAPLPLLAEEGDAEGEAAAAGQEEQAPAAQPEPPQVSEGELSKFVDCYLRVQEIRQRYDGILRQVENPEEAEGIQQRAITEMTQAISAGGMDIESYNTVAAAIAQNQEVNSRFSSMIEAKQQN